jgi:hypothetical protein
MHTQTLTFIHDLFARCDAAAFITLTAIHPDGDKPTPSRHIPLGDNGALHRALMRLLRANRHGWGAYIAIAPRKRNLGRWGRGTRRDLLCLPALFVDIDDPADALRNLEAFELPPSCILKSGRGYHAYWFLDQPTTQFAQADRVLRGLAERLHADQKLTVAQSMRLPGTINTKPGREDAACEFITYHPERRYRFDDFSPFDFNSTTPGVMALVPVRRSPVFTAASSSTGVEGTLPRPVLAALTAAVLRDLEGFPVTSGYVRARCPFRHDQDRPGMHFSYNAESGWGHCFGKHGSISPVELCRHLGVRLPPAYRTQYVRRHILDPLWSVMLSA